MEWGAADSDVLYDDGISRLTKFILNYSLPGSYKLWHAYLRARLDLVRNLPISHTQYNTLNNTFEQALVTMHKMPGIWIMYLQTLTHQKLVTRTRRTFDRALCALPVTQHERVWEPYLIFVSQKGVPIETSLRVYRRYLKYDPSHIEEFIEFLVISSLWQEASERLASVLNDDGFYSIKGKTKHRLWLKLWRLWTSLAEYYYIRRKWNLHEKARDVFEEGIMNVVTVRDFSVIFYLYTQFEESMLTFKIESMSSSDEEDEGGKENGMAKLENKILNGLWLHDDKDVDLRIAQLDYLINRRPELANSVLLQWHRRVELFEGDPKKQILTYTEAVRTIDPMWGNLIHFYYKAVDHLASVWCERAEMELRHQNFKGALELMRRATAEPSVESLGTLESTRIVYKQILDLRTATPQIILNYAFLLEEHKYFEDAFKAYERDIWVTYLSKFVKRYGKAKLERARELFEHAVETAPADAVKPLYLQYAKLEEDYGLAKRAMKVNDQATKAVPNNEKLSMEIYEQAIESSLPGKDVKTMCLKYAELEKSLGELDCARAIYVFASQFADPRSDVDFWIKWHEFEVQHGNEDTFREMLQIKRSVSASYSQTHFILPEYLMQKDQRLNLDDARDKLKQAGVAEDEMAALETQLAPVVDNGAAKDKNRRVGFVSAGVESQSEGGVKVTANHEDIELPEENVPSAVFGGLVRKRDEADNDAEAQDATATEEKDSDNRLGALERIKRLKKA
ncbi:hypothetical protein ACJW31_03G037500 [Castanea mollissima]